MSINTALTPKAAQQRPSLGVLVVDDDQTLAQNMVLALETYGLQARSAPNSREAMSIIQRNSNIGVVITDIRMPGDDGLALAGQIRKLALPEQAIEVVVTTGYATTDTVAQALRAGASDFLCKPFRLATVVQAVDQAMRRSLASREAYRQHQELLRRVEAFERAHIPVPLAGTDTPRHVEELNAISHGLRTPLHIAMGGLSLQEAAQGPRVGAGAQALHGGIHGMLRAIELVEELHRSKLTVGKRNPCSVSLQPLLAQCCAAAAPALVAQPPPLRVGLGEACVTATPEDLTRAITLCIEALSGWPSSNGEISLWLHGLPADDPDWICVTIQRGECAPMADPVLPREGTALSRTLEGLAFMAARRLLERDGAEVSSHSSDGRHGMIRIAWPKTRQRT